MSLYHFEYEFKISFEDLDPMNIVWHGNYMRYMEQARCNMLAKLGYTYSDMNEDNYAYPVAKMNVKYIKPAFFQDVLVMKLDILSIEPSLDIKYTIFNKASNEKIFEATTMQIAVDFRTMTSIYTPPIGLVNAVRRADNEKN